MAVVPVAAETGVLGERAVTVRAVTVIMGAVVGLSFLFAFGNVWTLGVRLGVPAYVAPLVAPAVDLSVVGLLLATRFLAVHGASPEQTRPAQRLLIFASSVTLALNVAEPMIAGQYGKAAFDSVGCWLLITWAHVGPNLLQAMTEAGRAPPPQRAGLRSVPTSGTASARVLDGDDAAGVPTSGAVPRQRPGYRSPPAGERDDDDLLERARAEDARHWELHRRPISAETLRKRLHVGSVRSRRLVAQLRADGARRRPDVAGAAARASRSDPDAARLAA